MQLPAAMLPSLPTLITFRTLYSPEQQIFCHYIIILKNIVAYTFKQYNYTLVCNCMHKQPGADCELGYAAVLSHTDTQRQFFGWHRR